MKDAKNNQRHGQSGVRRNKHTGHKDVSINDEGKLETFLDSIPEMPLLLVLDCVQDPHNLGACLRSANAAGVHAVIIPKDKSVSITETVVQVSCGGAENTPLFRVTNLSRTLSRLKERGIWLSGTSDKATQTLYETDLTGATAIVMGNEGKGMRRLTEEACDFLISIPMAGEVPCLNVSVATGVCLFEAVRQRLV